MKDDGYLAPFETRAEAEEGIRRGKRNAASGALLSILGLVILVAASPPIVAWLGKGTVATDLVIGVLVVAPLASGLGLLSEGLVRWTRARGFLAPRKPPGT